MIKKKKGFTLVEIITVIVLLSVIAVIFGANFVGLLRNNREDENKNVSTQIISAAEAYVSTNPEAVERLYTGYGYVDVTVGELRDAGLLSEEIKDAETGVVIADEEKVRVKVNLDDAIDVKYPLSDEEKGDVESLLMEAMDLYIDSSDVTSENWCSNDINVYKGLYRSSYYNDYNEYMNLVDSRLYLYTVSNESAAAGSVFGGNYFGTDADEPHLEVTSCDVNPKVAGDYKITYQYYDYLLKENKKVDRQVVVKTKRESDVVKFVAVINNNKRIVEKTPHNEIPIQITEEYADGHSRTLDAIPITDIETQGYFVTNFQTDNKGEYGATVTRKEHNSDGSIADPYLAPYRIVSSTYTVTFDPTGGVANPTSKIVKYETAYGTLATASRVGYTFQGWFNASKRQVRETTIFDLLDDVTLYAQWKPNNYTVLFNPNRGAVSTGSKTVTYDSKYGSLPVPNRAGYTFVGWFTTATGGIQITENSRVQITSTQTLYAHWEPKQFTVSFDPRGGSVTTKSKTVTYDSSYGTLPTPSRPGCKFEGWFTAPTGGTRITANSKVTITGNQTLYAQWSATYTVTFNNSGSISTRSCTAYNEALTCTMMMPNFSTPAYYRATGWNTNSNGTGTSYNIGTTITVSRNMTFYSQSKFEDFSMRLDSVKRSMQTDRIQSNINLMFIVDLSGSMWYPCSRPYCGYARINKAQEVMNNLVNKLSNGSTVSIVTHRMNSAYINLEYGSPYQARTVINGFYPDGNEDYSQGISAALRVLNWKPNNYPTYTIFISDATFASDGSVYISPYDYRINQLHWASTTYSVSMGDGFDYDIVDIMRSIASDWSKYYTYSDGSSIYEFNRIFDDITRDILIQVPNEESTVSYTYSNSGNVSVGYIGALNYSYPFSIYLGDRFLTSYSSAGSYLTRSGSYYYFNIKNFLRDYGSYFGITDYNKSQLKFKFYKSV